MNRVCNTIRNVYYILKLSKHIEMSKKNGSPAQSSAKFINILISL